MDNKLTLGYILPVLGAIFIIFFASSQPGEAIKAGGITNTGPLHVLEFLGLSFLIFRLFKKIKKSTYLAFVIGIGISILDELYQLLIPSRISSYGDLFRDFLGLLAGYLLFKVYSMLIPKLLGHNRKNHCY